MPQITQRPYDPKDQAACLALFDANTPRFFAPSERPEFASHLQSCGDPDTPYMVLIENGALRGNLYIRGGGDPKFVLERIQAAYMALQQQGIQVILGDMVLDHSAFELPVIDPGAFDGEALRPYNATPDALLVNFKSVILTFQPDLANGVAYVVSEPPMAGLAVDASVPLSRTACGDWRSAVRLVTTVQRWPINCSSSA